MSVAACSFQTRALYSASVSRWLTGSGAADGADADTTGGEAGTDRGAGAAISACLGDPARGASCDACFGNADSEAAGRLATCAEGEEAAGKSGTSSTGHDGGDDAASEWIGTGAVGDAPLPFALVT